MMFRPKQQKFNSWMKSYYCIFLSIWTFSLPEYSDSGSREVTVGDIDWDNDFESDSFDIEE